MLVVACVGASEDDEEASDEQGADLGQLGVQYGDECCISGCVGRREQLCFHERLDEQAAAANEVVMKEQRQQLGQVGRRQSIYQTV